MKIKIEPYQSNYRQAFHDINKQWITQYFKMEQPDIDALENPEEYILNRGGFIFVATIENEPVGVCALIPYEDSVYELAKMGVTPAARGQSVGWLLGQAAIKKARELKASRIYLESNTTLVPAINLYKKLGFKEIAHKATPYERCDIHMELKLHHESQE